MAQKIQLQIRRVVKGLNEGVSAEIGKAAFAAFQAIVIAAPVDTGHFRQNWQVALDAPSKGIVPGTDKSGQQVIGKAKAFFANYEMGVGGKPNKIFFSNNVAYALRLNEGHSQQAASGFVQKALIAGLKAVGASGKII